MPPLTRVRSGASSSRIIFDVERDSDSEVGSSSSSSTDALPSEQEDGDDDDAAAAESGLAVGISAKSGDDDEEEGARKRKAEPITISLKKVCKVCKRTGHQAGFRGATYIDCPMKPCFLCKTPGHTTMSCPHRVAMEHGVIPAPKRNTKTSLDYVFDRQLKAKAPMIKPAFAIPNQVDCGIIRFHSRRVTCLEFHPTKNNLLLSGDKKGQIGIWDYSKPHEKTVYGSIHSCIVNNMKFSSENDGTVFSASSDGTISCTDLETGVPFLLMDLNPNGWNGPATWHMLYGMDINTERGILLVADNFGYLYMLDSRSKTRIGQPILIHKKGTKVTGLHCNPVQPDLLLTCGNDHFARIWDARQLDNQCSIARLSHGRVVNSAYFSPLSGSKIMTTSQDNRIRVWDSIFGNLECPSREIVHSHDFNRHLTPFRAEWDPKDTSESLVVIGRYISENYNGIALHPIDFIDISTGKLIAEVMDPDITTISPVNKLHPRDDILASGSSRSLFIWRPKDKTLTPELERKPKEFIFGKADKKSQGKFDDGSDDDFSQAKSSKGKKSKSKPLKISQGKGKTKG